MFVTDDVADAIGETHWGLRGILGLGEEASSERLSACENIVWRARHLASRRARIESELAELATRQTDIGAKASVPGERQRYLSTLERMASREGRLKDAKAEIDKNLAELKARFDRIVDQVRGFPGMSGLGRHRHHRHRHGGGGWRGGGFFPYPAYYGPDILLIQETEDEDTEDEEGTEDKKKKKRKKIGWVPATPPSAFLGLLGCCD